MAASSRLGTQPRPTVAQDYAIRPGGYQTAEIARAPLQRRCFAAVLIGQLCTRLNEIGAIALACIANAVPTFSLTENDLAPAVIDAGASVLWGARCEIWPPETGESLAIRVFLAMSNAQSHLGNKAPSRRRGRGV
jgi:hypothetical protein